MEMEEIVRILIVVTVLIIAIWGAIFLITGKGGGILDSVKDFMRFGS